MSGYTNFAVVGAGDIGRFIVEQLLKDKAAGIVNEVVVLTRQVTYLLLGLHMMLSTPLGVDLKGSKTTRAIQGDAKIIQVATTPVMNPSSMPWLVWTSSSVPFQERSSMFRQKSLQPPRK